MLRRAPAAWLAGLLTLRLLVSGFDMRASFGQLWKPCATLGTTSWSYCFPGTIIKKEADERRQMLREMFSALSVLQNSYFSGVNGTWPSAIDWTSAVVQTVLSATLSSLTKSLDPPQFNAQATENLISTLYSQVTQSFFSQDVNSIKGQAFDDMLWVVLGWLEAMKFVRLHAGLHYPQTPDDDCNHLPSQIDDALKTLPWHGYGWTCAFSQRAREFWALAAQGWDTSLCHGGMVWNPRLQPYKNAITNELWIAASIGLHEQLPSTNKTGSYFDDGGWANGNPIWLAASVVGYEWLKAVNMTNQQGLYVDGYHISRRKPHNDKCDERDETVYTYNQGVILSGQRGLWAATGAGTFLDDGHALVQSVIAATGWSLSRGGPVDHAPCKLPPWQGLGRGGILEESCDADGTCSQDAQAFKGIFFHHLAAFCAPVNLASLAKAARPLEMKGQVREHMRRCRGYLAWMRHNVVAALATRDSHGRFGMWWGAGAFGTDLPAEPGIVCDPSSYRTLRSPQLRWLPDSTAVVRHDNDNCGELASGLDDPNARGRGRTVETQAGGLALLRGYWDMSRIENEPHASRFQASFTPDRLPEMPSLDGSLANGGPPSRPETIEQPDVDDNLAPPPSLDLISRIQMSGGHMALTEYSAKPSPPSGTVSSFRSIIPEDLLLPSGYPDYLRLIASATSRVYEACRVTPLTHAVNLSNRLECTVLLKREDTQPVFSFKLRGAYNKMAHLDPAVSWRGVVCCSAGNHAQGVAYSARKLKIPATIIMPEGTPSIKHANVARLGGHVVLHGADFDAAKEECARREKQDGLINIPPFDDPYVIAGQGTIGNELFGQVNMSKVEAVFCCCGGGGLIAGIGLYIKRMAPHVKVIGVEARDANAMAQSLARGERVVLDDVGLFADGAAVKTLGEETFRIAREVVDEVVQVSTDEICAAIRDMYDDTRSGLEPAGALSIAGVKKYVAQRPSSDPDRTLIAVTSGANMDFDRLRFVAERASLGEGREALLAVSIPERPGAFARLVDSVVPHAVTEFSYRYASGDQANVLIGLSLTAPPSQRQDELRSLLQRIRSDNMMVRDLSGDELAKSHVRYLVGGRSNVPNERLFQFSFPERPRALEKFLMALRPKFNITLFHYRNYGGNIGKVLAGISCPEDETDVLAQFLAEVGYPVEECTESDIFQTFLRA
ncbi:hypothetical protein CP532_5542 [Ophiocordyceps camponoti-leonardi (nom. inval.)]|nr:hypothetical protein CP532_5542 [Ophiocordyceps camponoti-leonardi (nom. inval.)]